MTVVSGNTKTLTKKKLKPPETAVLPNFFSRESNYIEEPPHTLSDMLFHLPNLYPER